MRPIFVLLLALAIFGSLAAYSRFVATLPRQEHGHRELVQATGRFSVELTLSFDAAQDAFSFDDAPAVAVRLAGRDLLRSTDPVPAGETLRAGNVEGIVQGRNAFFVQAVPSPEHVARPCAAQLKIVRDGHVVAENTIWSTPGSALAGELIVDVE